MRLGHFFPIFIVASGLALWAPPAAADDMDGGDAGAQDMDAGDTAPMGQTSPDNPEAQGVPLACDGSLCDTTTSSTIDSCTMAGSPADLAGPLLGILVARGIAAARRRGRTASLSRQVE